MTLAHVGFSIQGLGFGDVPQGFQVYNESLPAKTYILIVSMLVQCRSSCEDSGFPRLRVEGLGYRVSSNEALMQRV